MRLSMLSLSASILTAAVTTAGAQVPTEWTFELMGRSSLEPGIPAFNMPFLSSLSSEYVSMDAFGAVAIRAFLPSQEGIFFGHDGTGGLIVTVNAPSDPYWSTTLDLNNGMIAIEQGGFSDGAELYDTFGNLLHTFTIGGAEGVAGFSGVTLASDGAICYKADFGATGDKLMIDQFVGNVRMQQSIANTFDGTYSFLFAPKMNDFHQVVLNTIPETGPSRRIVRIDPDTTTTTIAETGSTYNSFVNSTSISLSGTAAYTARRSADSVWQVNHWTESGTIPIADGNNPDINNGSLTNFPPVTNDQWTAFRATDIAQNSTAIWVGDGDSLVKLIEYDQIMDTDLGPLPLGYDFGGLTGKQVTSGVIDINEAGQVAFSAFLRNGTIGIFVATPSMGCIADLTEDGELDFFDISAFVTAYSANNLKVADFTGDGSLDFFDIAAFIAAYSEGCP